MKFLFTTLFILSHSAFASTPPGQVDRIDSFREGNLAQLVLKHYKANFKVGCAANGTQLQKVEIIKLASASHNQEKRPGTPFNYEATYLILEKCLYGSTYAGAYSDSVKSVAMKGSFHSNYDENGGPAMMEDLMISLVKEIDTSLPQN